MLEKPACPVCESDDWEQVGTRTFRRSDAAPSAYVAARLRVLFEVWRPGEESVTMRWLLCRRCGFVTYAPRATADEVARKYAFLANEVREESRTEGSALDRKRSMELVKGFGEHLPPARGADGPATLLDFGGGNGALSIAFAELGFRCGVVDYVPHSVPGVERLGSTLDELPPGRAFDVVLCSHVIEHVPEPLTTLRRLRTVVRDGGVVLVAVPMEIRRGPPAMQEPVTHVSFFCESSLATLLRKAGFHVVKMRTARGTSSHGTLRHEVVGIGRRDDAKAIEVTLPGCEEAQALLRQGKLGSALADVMSWLRGA